MGQIIVQVTSDPQWPRLVQTVVVNIKGEAPRQIGTGKGTKDGGITCQRAATILNCTNGSNYTRRNIWQKLTVDLVPPRRANETLKEKKIVGRIVRKSSIWWVSAHRASGPLKCAAILIIQYRYYWRSGSEGFENWFSFSCLFRQCDIRQDFKGLLCKFSLQLRHSLLWLEGYSENMPTFGTKCLLSTCICLLSELYCNFQKKAKKD